MSKSTMLSFSSNFGEMDVMFLEFVEDLDNLAGGSWLVNDNLGESNNRVHFNLGLFELFSDIICSYNLFSRYFSTICDSDS